MASIVLSPIVTQIVEKLSDLALHHISLFCTLQTELQNLKVTVSAIHAVLLDAEEQQFHNRQVKDWLEKLSEVMYDVDDLLDDFATEAALKKLAAAAEDDYVERRKTTCWSTTVCSSSKQLMYGYRMAREIRAIREKLELLSKDKDNFHLEVRVDDDLASLPFRETDSCPPTIVVGRKDDHSKIVELLLDFESGDNISVVPIVGIGGLGKTTLAQLAFDDERMIESFEIKVWVYVSQNFDIKAILAKMLESINRKSQPADLALDVLKVLFQDKIRGKRFLFVLDDVWEENEGSWEALGKYLTVGAPGSKVLVTTRSRLVAEVSSKILKPATSTSLVGLPYFLEGLELDEAWNLMVKKAGVVPQSSNVESIAREILGKCCGVPLAVNMVAGLLSSTDPETEWPLFLQKELWTISEGENPIMSALRLSFNHLPAHLKRCFAYCKLFPKGHVFDVQRLVQFWRAQGYIESADRGLELNMGLRYFKTLWWRSFFQEVLDLSWCRLLKELPRDLKKMVNLMHLYLYPLGVKLTHMPKGIGELTSLLTLPVFVVSKKKKSRGNDNKMEEEVGGLDELKALNALRGELTIKNLVKAESVETRLELRKTGSQSLLRTMNMKTTTMASSPPLSKLTSLQLVEMDDLETLPEEGLSNLTSLQVLEIVKCLRLASLSAVRNLHSLQKLDILECPQLNDRCRKGKGEDWPNISHQIPGCKTDSWKVGQLGIGADWTLMLSEKRAPETQGRRRCSDDTRGQLSIVKMVHCWDALSEMRVAFCTESIIGFRNLKLEMLLKRVDYSGGGL
ncbi:unnamed protein product [Linum tenue]|uniref:Disease resistance protein RGA3 n=1 Tax=Linum tenue TaxID=586396 RepID=A0AAV0L3I1_9ROSI|nr:unnamed protein product [Linum tenue]